jgi:hypothetical protein
LRGREFTHFFSCLLNWKFLTRAKPANLQAKKKVRKNLQLDD